MSNNENWPWDPNKPEELTDDVLADIVQNLPSYTEYVACLHPKHDGYINLKNDLQVYCQVAKKYFTEKVKNAPDLLKPKVSEIAEEAFELIDMLLQWCEGRRSPYWDNLTDQVAHDVPCSHNELTSKWDTILRKLDMYEHSEDETAPITDDSVQEDIKSQEGENKKRNRPTKAEMANRNRTVTMAAAQIQVKYDRLPTVAEISEETKLPPEKIYATAPYIEGKIAKASVKTTGEITGSSITESEHYGEKSVKHSRVKRRSEAEQAEMDALIDEQKKDDKSNFVT